jgi:hypothetical protein
LTNPVFELISRTAEVYQLDFYLQKIAENLKKNGPKRSSLQPVEITAGSVS